LGNRPVLQSARIRARFMRWSRRPRRDFAGENYGSCHALAQTKAPNGM